MTLRIILASLGVALFALFSCSLDPQPDVPGASSKSASGGSSGTVNAGANASYGPSSEQDAGTGNASIPDEQKNALFEAPVVTGTLLWSTNAQSGRVAVMDANTLVMKTYYAGLAPKYLVAVPTSDGVPSAIVLNTGSSDATWLRLPEGLGGEVTAETITTHRGANSCTVSPSGRWAIAWTDARLVQGADITQQFQDATVIDLRSATSGKRSTVLGVGKRPASVSFDQNEERALIVTREAISVIELTGETPLSGQDLFFQNDGTSNSSSRDVAVTPDGRLALVRRGGTSLIEAIDLNARVSRQFDLGSVVTDLDLRQDGGMALAVLRDASEVVALGLPSSGTELTESRVALPDEFFGSAALAADGSLAVLYTTAVNYDHVTTLSFAPEGTTSTRTWAVKAPVTDMFLAPDAQHALAFLAVSSSSTAKGAFAVIPTQVALSPKIVSLPAPPHVVAMAPAPTDRLLVTLRDDDTRTYGVYVIKLPSLEANLVTLASPPVAAGILPVARKGYVAQAHPEGRITVLDLDQGTTQTVTGFELAAKVRYSE